MARLAFTSAVLRTCVALSALAALSACASHKPPPPAPTEQTPPAPRDAYAPPPPREGPTSSPMGPAGAARPGSTQDFVVSAGDRVYFDYDQYTIRDDGRAVLDRQAQWLSRYPQVAVRIEGNADERGTEEYNFALAGRRAEAIKAYLVAHGVGAGRVSTISYGKERPLTDASDEQSMAKNRNGHTAITSGASGG